VVMEAVRQDGHALQHASEKLRGNFQVLLEAVNQNVDAFQYATDIAKVFVGV